MIRKPKLSGLIYLLYMMSGDVLAQQASIQLPNCLEVNPLNTADRTSRRFEVHNACGKTISEVVYARSYKTKENTPVTTVIAQGFLSLIEWSTSDFNADDFSAVLHPSTRSVITFSLTQEEAKAGANASSLDVFILALGYSNGGIEGIEPYREQVVSLRKGRLANTNEEVRVLKELAVPGRLEAMCAADEESRKVELERMGALTIALFQQRVRNACQVQTWNGKGGDSIRGGLLDAERRLALIQKQMGGR